MTNNTDPVRALADLAERAVPFLRDEAAKYDDDGSNEPLELAREIETALASLPSDESALSSANSAFDGGREAAIASAPPSAPDDVNRLVRELDVALNGPDGAAAQASLCDLVGQVQRIVRERGAPLLAPSATVGVDEAAAVLADLHPFLFGLKLAAPNEEKRAFIQERIDAVRRASAALAAQQPAGVDGRIAIEPGERLFQFDSKQEWINHASRIWRLHGVRSEDTVCVDALGRLVNIGKHFADAERDRAYPIVVYRLRADMNRNTGAAQQQGGRADG